MRLICSPTTRVILARHVNVSPWPSPQLIGGSTGQQVEFTCLCSISGLGDHPFSDVDYKICTHCYCHESGWIGGMGPPAGSGRNHCAEQSIESHVHALFVRTKTTLSTA